MINIWNFVLWRWPGNKRLICFDDSKYDALVPGHSEKRFNTNSHFRFYDPATGNGQWYDDAASQALRCMCVFLEIFDSCIWFNISWIVVKYQLIPHRYTTYQVLPIMLTAIYSNHIEVTWYWYVILFLLLIGFICLGMSF